MAKNYSSSTLSVWRKSLNIVHSIVAPILFIWKQEYFKVIAVVNAACEKINGSFVSLRKGYLKRKKSIQDALDRWSAHSSVGYALVVGFNAAVMLLMTTFAIEFAYHFRPYYWTIVMMIYASVNSTCAQLPPGLLRGICPPCKSRGWGICKFCTARGPGICQPPGHSRAFDTHAVSYQNITTQKVLLEKSRLAHLSRTGINGVGL